MPFVKVYIHFVWSTKGRIPFLNTKEIRAQVWKHIKENSEQKDIFIDCVNGYSDHCHCLISLGLDQNIAKIMQLIKGESSYWINKNNLTNEKFSWQTEYFATSVSKSNIGRVRNYILNQENHHKKKSFRQEYDEIINKFNFEV